MPLFSPIHPGAPPWCTKTHRSTGKAATREAVKEVHGKLRLLNHVPGSHASE
jgi:hypothetical protein